jgi:hypothetical protein
MKTSTATLAAVGACAAACAAAVIGPSIMAGAAIGGIGAALSGELGMAIVVMAGGGALWFALSRRKVAQAKACDCAPDAGCETGDTCDLPKPKALSLPGTGK